jgi:citrate lyase subunit beta/citryl-CoA lyase
MLGPIRSLLFVPGIRQDRFEKAMNAGADAVVFDLEDAVEASQKAKARDLVGEFLSRPRASDAARLVRFNAVNTAAGEDDLEVFAPHPAFDGVLLPKVETVGVVDLVTRLFRQYAPAHQVPLLLQLETPRAVLRASDIAAASASIAALVFGGEDFTAQLGVPRTIDGEELLLARSQVVLAAAAAGIDAIDTVFTDVNDLAVLRRDSERARALGFRGKIAIHPRQVPVINEVFTPGGAEIDRARRLIETYEAAASSGEGVTTLDGQMVELPIVDRARRVLALAAKYGSR